MTYLYSGLAVLISVAALEAQAAPIKVVYNPDSIEQAPLPRAKNYAEIQKMPLLVVIAPQRVETPIRDISLAQLAQLSATRTDSAVAVNHSQETATLDVPVVTTASVHPGNNDALANALAALAPSAGGVGVLAGQNNAVRVAVEAVPHIVDTDHLSPDIINSIDAFNGDRDGIINASRLMALPINNNAQNNNIKTPIVEKDNSISGVIDAYNGAHKGAPIILGKH